MSTILIVDDEELTRFMVRQVLENKGFHVLEARDGQEALDMCLMRDVHLVLMDVRMPRLNGFEACQALRQQPKTLHMPVLMLTSMDDAQSVSMAFDAGATDFVTKPINWGLLAQRILYALRTHSIELQLRENQTVLHRAQQLARIGQWRLDTRTGQLELSGLLRQILNLGSHETPPLRSLLRQVDPADRHKALDFVRTLLRTGQSTDPEIVYHTPQHSAVSLTLSGDPDADSGSAKPQLFGIAQDVTAWRKTHEQLHFQAHFDAGTGLPNRTLFRLQSAQAMQNAESEGRSLALLNISLDTQQKMQAALGDHEHDSMWQTIAQRLQGIVLNQGSLARLDTNTFAILVEPVENEDQVVNLAAALSRSFAEPIPMGESALLLTTSCGVALFPQDGQDVDTLLLHSGVAKTRVAPGQTLGYQFYVPSIQKRVQEQFSTEVALFQALQNGEFVLHYQPKIQLATGKAIGVEALLRWNRPGFGLQPPDSFIPILEQTGLMVAVGQWVIRQACADIQALGLNLAVNVSPKQFQHKQLASQTTLSLQETHFPAHRLELEITEQAVVADLPHAVQTLQTLRASGIRTSLDDYGIGYSSLDRLKVMPLDTLKIDKSFVLQLLHNDRDQAIVLSTSTLAHQFGLTVVAEGVETREAFEWLREIGVDIGQGYFFARPMPLATLQEWLNSPKAQAFG